MVVHVIGAAAIVRRVVLVPSITVLPKSSSTNSAHMMRVLGTMQNCMLLSLLLTGERLATLCALDGGRLHWYWRLIGRWLLPGHRHVDEALIGRRSRRRRLWELAGWQTGRQRHTAVHVRVGCVLCRLLLLLYVHLLHLLTGGLRCGFGWIGRWRYWIAVFVLAPSTWLSWTLTAHALGAFVLVEIRAEFVRLKRLV